jgi:hypothetical protein
MQKDKNVCIIYRCAPKKKESIAPLLAEDFNYQYTKLLNSREAPRVTRLNCQKKNFKCEHILTFFSNSDFYCEKNNLSEVYTYIPKIQKKRNRFLNMAVPHFSYRSYFSNNSKINA